MNAMNAGIPSVWIHTLQYIRELIQVKNPSNVLTVGNLSVRSHTLDNIQELT